MNGPRAKGAGVAGRGGSLCRLAHSGPARKALFQAARWTAVLMLLLAAAGKAASLVRGDVQPLLGLAAPSWTAVLVIFECGLAAWLIGLWQADACRMVAAAAFLVFAGAGGIGALRGETHCGCFGVVQVPVGIMVMLDLAVALALLAGRPGYSVESVQARSRLVQATCWLALALCGAPAVAAAAGVGRYLASSHAEGAVLLTPQTISGRTARFLAHVQGAGPLTRGRWRVLVYRSDCGRCAAALREFVRAAQGERTASRQTAECSATPPATAPTRARGVKVQYAVLLLPGSRLPPAYAPTLRAFQAKQALTWYAVTPLLLELRDGLVQRAHMDVQAALESDARPGVGRLSTARHVVWSACFTATRGAAALLRRPARGPTGRSVRNARSEGFQAVPAARGDEPYLGSRGRSARPTVLYQV